MRLVTRSDFDGLACGALLRELGIVDRWKFVHPKDLQDGLVGITGNDVLANVPYVPGCKLWFDHHSSESERLGRELQYNGDSRLCDSAARVIYNYYNGGETLLHLQALVDTADRISSGKLTEGEIRDPKGWILLGFLADPRTGLGRFRRFRISNYRLMEELVDLCRTQCIDEILAHPDVAERVRMLDSHREQFTDMLRRNTRVEGAVTVTDLRGVNPIYTGNRYYIYTLYPEQTASVWVVEGRDKQNCAIAAGMNILNSGGRTDVGALLLRLGGGGHRRRGTCQVPHEDADRVIASLVGDLQA